MLMRSCTHVLIASPTLRLATRTHTLMRLLTRILIPVCKRAHVFICSYAAGLKDSLWFYESMSLLIYPGHMPSYTHVFIRS